MHCDAPLTANLPPRFDEYHRYLNSLPRKVGRSLQRQWKRSLAGIALLLALGMAPALAATLNVNARCSLPQAITSANNNSRVGGCAKGAGVDTIVLPTNSTQTLTRLNNTTPFFGSTGLPVIRSAITIAGNGSTIRRAPTAPNFKIFSVGGPGNLSLQRTTVSGGRGGIFNINSVSLSTSTSIEGN